MRAFAIAAVAVVFLSIGTAATAQIASIQFDHGQFKVTGWKATPVPPAGGWGSVFDIYAGMANVPPMLGAYTVENGTLIFRPAFPIAAGVKYRAVFHAPGSTAVEQIFDGPRLDKTPSAHVVNVYPSGDVLPSNQLRLYIYFSVPMSGGEAADHIHILNDKGKSLAGPRALFLPGEELWDPNFQRLTLTFDPGRIKRGLTANRAIGPPIAEGKRYTLVIDRGWQDARGVPMTEDFRKSFRGGPAVRTPPNPKEWRVSAPKSGTSGALVVDFPEPMNFPLLQRMIAVSSAKGRIEGAIDVARNETEWRFTPREAWKPGVYRLVIDTGIEDLAGNHIGQPFDIDTFERVTEHIATASVTLPFAVR